MGKERTTDHHGRPAFSMSPLLLSSPTRFHHPFCHLLSRLHICHIFCHLPVNCIYAKCPPVPSPSWMTIYYPSLCMNDMLLGTRRCQSVESLPPHRSRLPPLSPRMCWAQVGPSAKVSYLVIPLNVRNMLGSSWPVREGTKVVIRCFLHG